jgi:hypothetical protein
MARNPKLLIGSAEVVALIGSAEVVALIGSAEGPP